MGLVTERSTLVETSAFDIKILDLYVVCIRCWLTLVEEISYDDIEEVIGIVVDASIYELSIGYIVGISRIGVRDWYLWLLNVPIS